MLGFNFQHDSSDADEAAEAILQLRKSLEEAQSRILNLETIEGAVEVLKSRGATTIIEPPNPGCYSGKLVVTLLGYREPKPRPSDDPIVQMFFDTLKDRIGSDLRSDEEYGSCSERARLRFEKAATWLRTDENNRRLLNLATINEKIFMFKYLTATEHGPVHFLIKLRKQDAENWIEVGLQPEENSSPIEF